MEYEEMKESVGRTLICITSSSISGSKQHVDCFSEVVSCICVALIQSDTSQAPSGREKSQMVKEAGMRERTQRKMEVQVEKRRK